MEVGKFFELMDGKANTFLTLKNADTRRQIDTGYYKTLKDKILELQFRHIKKFKIEDDNSIIIWID